MDFGRGKRDGSVAGNTDILEYRKAAKDAYRSWFVAISKWASEIDAMTPAEVSKQLPKLKAEKLLPGVVEYRNELKTIAEKLWGDLLKTFARYLTGIGPPDIFSTLARQNC